MTNTLKYHIGQRVQFADQTVALGFPRLGTVESISPDETFQYTVRADNGKPYKVHEAQLILPSEEQGNPELTQSICTDHAQAALAAHSLHMGIPEQDQRDALTDILTNLRHYAEVHMLDFYLASDTSYQHYLAERKG